MKRKIISAMAAVGISLSLLGSSYAIAMDAQDHWAREEIQYLEQKGVMLPDAYGRFRPNDLISRAEFIKAINNTFSYGDMATINFIDVSPDSWYYNDIRRAVAAGYINGYEDGSIRPNDSLSREEAAKILALATGLDRQLPKSLYGFTDVANMSNWSVIHINNLSEKGYMAGYEDGTFRPQESLSRGETAVILSSIKRERDQDYHINLVKRNFIPNRAIVNSPSLEAGGSFTSWGYSLQVATFSNLDKAKQERDRFIGLGFNNTIIVRNQANQTYSVLVESFLDINSANNLKKSLKEMQLDSFITDRVFTDRDLVDLEPINPVSTHAFKPSPRPEVSQARTYSVQAGSFNTIDAAVKYKNSLINSGFSKSHIMRFNDSPSYFVIAETGLGQQEAQILRDRLIKARFDGYVINRDMNLGFRL